MYRGDPFHYSHPREQVSICGSLLCGLDSSSVPAQTGRCWKENCSDDGWESTPALCIPPPARRCRIQTLDPCSHGLMWPTTWSSSRPTVDVLMCRSFSSRQALDMHPHREPCKSPVPQLMLRCRSWHRNRSANAPSTNRFIHQPAFGKPAGCNQDCFAAPKNFRPLALALSLSPAPCTLRDLHV